MVASATLQLAEQWRTYRSRLAVQAQVANEQHSCINIVLPAQDDMPSPSATNNGESSACSDHSLHGSTMFLRHIAGTRLPRHVNGDAKVAVDAAIWLQ